MRNKFVAYVPGDAFLKFTHSTMKTKNEKKIRGMDNNP